MQLSSSLCPGPLSSGAAGDRFRGAAASPKLGIDLSVKREAEGRRHSDTPVTPGRRLINATSTSTSSRPGPGTDIRPTYQSIVSGVFTSQTTDLDVAICVAAKILPPPPSCYSPFSKFLRKTGQFRNNSCAGFIRAAATLFLGLRKCVLSSTLVLLLKTDSH